MIKIPEEHACNKMGNDKAQQFKVQLDAKVYEAKQKNFVEDKPEMHQLVIFKGT